MKQICFYFQVHQPCRIAEYSFFELGNHHYYFNESLDEGILNKVSDNCYLPTNELLLSLIQQFEGKFQITFSLSGILIEQLEKYRPDVLKSFQDLVKTGCVEILGETYYHSLSALYNQDEFAAQVQLHKDKIQEVFGVQPHVFRNTELIYSDQIATQVKALGFDTILADGIEWNLKQRTPNQLFCSPENELNILVRNTHLSDDIAFRFADPLWKEAPLTATKYMTWCEKEEGDILNLFMDYETFGEHQKREAGIFDFLEDFVKTTIKEDYSFVTPSTIIAKNNTTEVYHVPMPISWADQSKDVSTWLANAMQRESLLKIYAMKREISHRKDLLDTWRKLQTSDLFYYMSTKTGQDGDVHRYFRPYPSAYDTYVFYMNILSDLKNRL